MAIVELIMQSDIADGLDNSNDDDFMKSRVVRYVVIHMVLSYHNNCE